MQSNFPVRRPTNDLALLILSSLPSNIRRDCTQKLLTLYYTFMNENLGKLNIDINVTLGYTKEKLFEDYKYVESARDDVAGITL